LSQTQHIFSKVMTRGERMRVFRIALESRNQIFCQGNDKKNVRVIASEISDGRMNLAVRRIDYPALNGPILVTFQVQDERYFMKTEMSDDQNGYYHFRLDRPLFKLQRRDNFRVSLEVGVRGQFKFSKINGLTFNQSLFVFDLSGGGVGLEYPARGSITLGTGDEVQGRIVLSNGFEAKIQGSVKYTRPYGSMGSELVRTGIEFLKLAHLEREEIINAVVSINRDIFMASRLGA
jgi:c-di-GMP-binding flagellar brake protein YcgR